MCICVCVCVCVCVEGRCYTLHLIASITLDLYLLILSIKHKGIKYNF